MSPHPPPQKPGSPNPAITASTRPALPSTTASPSQVRAFLASLLQVITNQTPAPQAHEIAAKWTVGTGRQLRSYPPMMFLDIFGRQDGWLIYREVRLEVHGERVRGEWWYRNGTYAVFFAFLALDVALLLALLLLLRYKPRSAAVPVVSGLAAGVLFCLLLTGFILSLERRESMVDRIEAVLANCMGPTGTKRD